MHDHRVRLPEAGLPLTVIHSGMVWSDREGCTAAIVAAVAGVRPVRIVGSPSVR
jgi:hypothetical protein